MPPAVALKPSVENAVFCLAASAPQADQVFLRLKHAGVPAHSISALFPGPPGPQVAGRSWRGSAWSAARRVGFGCIATFEVPELGICIAAGPIIFAFNTGGTGGAADSLATGLIALGIAKSEAERYGEKIKRGKILISAPMVNPLDRSPMSDLLAKAGAEVIRTTVEVPAD